MKENNDLLLAFYGDDFTGSTDALEFIAKAGAKTVLFTEPPTVAQLAAFPGLNAFGVAGNTRALAPAEMEQVLRQAFRKMKETGAAHVHYKVCSTFDSSRATGSIGKAIDCGAEIFGGRIIPLLGGMPALGRYCVFGNLFARMGIGSQGKIYRLDRHPSMSKHPVTPADESDLRLHLATQTTKTIGLIDVLQLETPLEKWNDYIGADEQVVLIDALYETQLEKIGEWMDMQCRRDEALFSVGSSSIEMALGRYWNRKKIITPVEAWVQPGRAMPLLVVSGSCSPVTEAQITWALANGFTAVELDAVEICNEGNVPERTGEQVNDLLLQQKNVIVHTGLKQSQPVPPGKLGAVLGQIAKKAVQVAGLRRVVVAGGDTSSYAARTMEIDAVEMIAPLVSGAPLCRAHSVNKTMNGLEVNFKGGQVGSDDYFGVLLNGRI